MIATGQGNVRVVHDALDRPVHDLRETDVSRRFKVIRQLPEQLDEQFQDQADVRDRVDQSRRSEPRRQRHDARCRHEPVVDHLLNRVGGLVEHAGDEVAVGAGLLKECSAGRSGLRRIFRRLIREALAGRFRRPALVAAAHRPVRVPGFWRTVRREPALGDSDAMLVDVVRTRVDRDLQETILDRKERAEPRDECRLRGRAIRKEDRIEDVVLLHRGHQQLLHVRPVLEDAMLVQAVLRHHTKYQRRNHTEAAA